MEPECTLFSAANSQNTTRGCAHGKHGEKPCREHSEHVGLLSVNSAARQCKCAVSFVKVANSSTILTGQGWVRVVRVGLLTGLGIRVAAPMQKLKSTQICVGAMASVCFKTVCFSRTNAEMGKIGQNGARALESRPRRYTYS